MTIKQQLIIFFLDFQNNYLTVDKYAEDKGLTRAETLLMLDAGMKLNNQQF